jgi:hypothetical protein
MQLSPGIAEFPTYPLIRRAYDVARSLRGNSEDLQVGIVDPTGVLLATGVLKGYRQAAMMAEMLRRVGFQELLPRTAQKLCDCDMGFVGPADGVAEAQPVLSQEILDVECWSEGDRLREVAVRENREMETS